MGKDICCSGNDGSYIEYPNDHHDAIKKIRKKRAECNHE
ncbi:hypothetical protein CHCC5021_1754 [Bacillus paralicheniformis]|nr:hypothetical protein CHCC5021_1754 [Bacillus paralicheniformis]TWL09469.1 hypothetical protein CHCC19468_1680 [Bacillus paralicheniformis]